MLPDVDSLALFVRAAELRSLTKAAEASHIGLAAASRRMALLEHRFKTTLLERSPRGVEPTPAGKALLAHAKALLVQMNQMQAEMSDHASGRKGAVKSIYHMAHAVVPLMRQRKKGVILNVGSTAGIRPRPGLTWYNGSKGAVNLLSKSMAVELGPDNIRVNAICPVMGETGLLSKFMGVPDTPENRARFIATIPLGRLCRASDVAGAALYLATDAAEFISGVEFPVDGARTV